MSILKTISNKKSIKYLRSEIQQVKGGLDSDPYFRKKGHLYQPTFKAQIVSWILSMASCQAWGPICTRTNHKLKRSDRSDSEKNFSQRDEICHPRATDEGRPSNVASKQLSGSNVRH